MRVCTNFQDSVSHILAVLSADALTRNFPSVCELENLTDTTAFSWPEYHFSNTHEPIVHKLKPSQNSSLGLQKLSNSDLYGIPIYPHNGCCTSKTNLLQHTLPQFTRLFCALIARCNCCWTQRSDFLRIYKGVCCHTLSSAAPPNFSSGQCPIFSCILWERSQSSKYEYSPDIELKSGFCSPMTVFLCYRYIKIESQVWSGYTRKPSCCEMFSLYTSLESYALANLWHVTKDQWMLTVAYNKPPAHRLLQFSSMQMLSHIAGPTVGTMNKKATWGLHE